ncbi:hypothetical protein G5B39_15265 (plasmid) [Rhodobacteraceae bacterium SC52]|nr:hypothetical protein G5B39_15265 [Rhodobacteraceae bacterium SC52]
MPDTDQSARRRGEIAHTPSRVYLIGTMAQVRTLATCARLTQHRADVR